MTVYPELAALAAHNPGACCNCGARPDDLFSFSVEVDGHTYDLRACPCECAFDLGLLVAPYYEETREAGR